MCKCVINSNSLRLNVSKAKGLEIQNKNKYGVYVITNPKTLKSTAFVATVSAIKKQKGVCCYYNSDGVNVDIVKPEKKKKAVGKKAVGKKDVENDKKV